MKKLSLFISLLIIVGLSSCEKIKDATAIDIDTELTADIPVTSENSAVAISLKSQKIEEDVYNFGGSATFSLADNPDIADYLGKIRNMAAKEGGVLTFLGATDGNEILTCTITVNGATYSIPEPVSAGNGVIALLIDTYASQVINKIEDNPGATYSVEVSGTANYDVETTAKLKIPATISASPL